MSSDSHSVHLHSVDLRVEQDIVLCRQHARQFAAALGFDLQTQTRIATAVSEIARNAYQYAGGGRVEFFSESEVNSARRFDLRRQSIVIIVRDQGGGIPDLPTVLGGGYRSTTGMGLGILGARRLMDCVDIQTGDGGTVIILEKALSPNAIRRTGAQIQEVVVTRPETAVAETTVIAEVQRQNQELLTVMDEVQQRQDDLAQLNQELAETNSGVLALYDELETLHRVGLLLASKIDLPAVMQALIEATTDLTGAEFGACYMYNERASAWERYADAGPRRNFLDEMPKNHPADFFGPSFGEAGLTHVPDLNDVEGETTSVAGFVAALNPSINLRTCLAFPLKSSDNAVVGALIFGSSEPRIFSERSERIVASIAAQAIVAVEKARLFDSVKAASEAKDRFLAMISHELRTPLNPVLSIMSSLHEDASLPAELREDIAVVLRNVQLEARLIDDLLDFQRIIKGNMSFASEPVNVHSIVGNVVDICRMDFESRSQHLHISLDAPRHIVLGDSARLQQILWNVLKNAIKFTPAHGTISILTSMEAGGDLRIAFTDTGRGIEPEMLQGIFGAFDQGSVEGATEFGGLGLGLAIVKSFIEKHGGTVQAESAGRNKGTSIILRLPVVDLTVTGLPHREQSSGPQPVARDRAVQHLLLVDDHHDTLESLARLLSRKGYAVTTAASCAEALERAKEKLFDIICSDLGLPDGSGLQLIADIRNLGITTPAIAISGYGMESDVSQSHAAGFDMHLTKPVSIPNLITAFDKVLEGAG